MTREDIAMQMAIIEFDERTQKSAAENLAYTRRKEVRAECAKLTHLWGPGVGDMGFFRGSKACVMCGERFIEPDPVLAVAIDLADGSR